MNKKVIKETLKPFLSKKFIIPVIIILVLIGYQQISGMIKGAIMAKMRSAPIKVELSEVKAEEIEQSTKSSGRIEAKYSVDIIARVQGWLQRSYFKEGSYVKKGQVLFQIEPNEYQNVVNKAAAAVRESKAQLVNDEKSLRRATELVKNDFVSKSYYDEALARRDSTKSALYLNRASLSQANLDLSYTRIKSPIDGRIGNIYITQGNLVNAQSGVLAKIVSLDPIYIKFPIKSEDYLKLRKTAPEKKNEDLSFIIPEVILSDGSLYPIKGKLDFVDNQVDPSTGTINLRATFDNPQHLLLPGDYVTVRSTSTIKRNVLLIPQEAVMQSSQGTFVYVVDEKNQAQVRPIKTDGQYNGHWIISEGLGLGDKYIISNLQRLRPEVKVEIIDKNAVQKDKE